MKDVKEIVREGYSGIATEKSCCCSCSSNKEEQERIAKNIGYSDEELETPGNLGLGCGNPVALSNIKETDVVLDLGCGAGFDCFLASKKAPKGKVIGVDMTPEMIKRARENAEKFRYENVEFILGEIENLPVDDNSVDVLISNCVINLSPDKHKVFNEIKRVLKNGGTAFISDIVLLDELTDEQKNNPDLLVGCVAGALLKEDYLKLVSKAGLEVEILSEDKRISKTQYNGVNLESLKLKLTKNTEAKNGRM